MRKDTPLLFSVPVWGEHHVNVFLSYSLKSQLAPENIPALKSLNECEYHIYTLPCHEEQIRSSSSFSHLSKYLNVKINYIPNKYFSRNKYDIKSKIYRADLIKASRLNKANVFCNADILFSNGFISKAQEIIGQFRTVEVVGPRINLDDFTNFLNNNESYASSSSSEEYFLVNSKYISIASSLLSFLSVSFLNNMCEKHFFNPDKPSSFHPSHVYWKAGKPGEEGIVAHCYHLYPILFNARDLSADFLRTVDDDLVVRSSIALGERFFTTDSSTMFCCELSPNLPPEAFDIHLTSTIRNTLRFYRGHSFFRKRLEHFMIPHIFGNLKTPKASWDLAFKQAEAFNQEIRKGLSEDSWKDLIIAARVVLRNALYRIRR